uniref:Uncharacterized protein n=1 Tax=Arundo donax TaxID=35708 RepID=A0A0A9UCX5_ARUDO
MVFQIMIIRSQQDIAARIKSSTCAELPVNNSHNHNSSRHYKLLATDANPQQTNFSSNYMNRYYVILHHSRQNNSF